MAQYAVFFVIKFQYDTLMYMNIKKYYERMASIAGLFVVLILLFGLSPSPISSVDAQTAGTTPVSCGTGPLLGFYSDSNSRTFLGSDPRVMSGEVGQPLEKPKFTGSNQILSTSDNLVIVVASGLPAGARVERKIYNFTAGPQVWHVLAGTPTTVGQYTLKLTATKPGCPSDTGTIKLSIAPAGVSCGLGATTPTAVGQATTLNWTITGPVVSGTISPAISGSPDFTKKGSAPSLPLATDTIFTLNVVGSNGETNSCRSPVKVGGTSGSSVSFVKSVVFDSASDLNALAGFIFWNNKFVISARCRLWFLAEDGSKFTKREACLDGGSASNAIYQHATGEYALHLEWGSGNLVRTNASMNGASCAREGPSGLGSNWDCAEFGPSAGQAVLYGPSGDSAYIISKSPYRLYNSDLTVLKNKVIARQDSNSLVKLPDWQLGGIVPSAPNAGFRVGFGDYAVGSGFGTDFKSGTYLYSVSDSGAITQVKKLVESGSVLHAFENTTNPPKLALMQYDSRTGHGGKILVYKLVGDNVELDREIVLPSGFKARQFAIWGNYILTPLSGGGTVGDPVIKSGFEVWKNGQKIDTIRSVGVGSFVGGLLVSPSGYVALIYGGFSTPTVDIYKINDTAGTTEGGGTTTSTVATATPIVPGEIQGGTLAERYAQCDASYPGDAALTDLCKKVELLKETVCSLAPTISFCSAVRGTSGGGSPFRYLYQN